MCKNCFKKHRGMQLKKVFVIENSQNDFEDIVEILKLLDSDVEVYPKLSDYDIETRMCSFAALIDDVIEILRPATGDSDSQAESLKDFLRVLKDFEPDLIIIDVLLLESSESSNLKGDFLWEKYISKHLKDTEVVFLTEKSKGSFKVPKGTKHIFKERKGTRLDRDIILVDLKRILEEADNNGKFGMSQLTKF